MSMKTKARKRKINGTKPNRRPRIRLSELLIDCKKRRITARPRKMAAMMAQAAVAFVDGR